MVKVLAAAGGTYKSVTMLGLESGQVTRCWAHLCYSLETLAQVQLGQGAAFLILHSHGFSSVLTSMQVVPDGFGIMYMTGCGSA